MKVNTYYVYELWNPITNKIFYVGKGTKYNNSYYRLSNHIKDSKYALDGKIPMNHKFRTILQIIEQGLKPEIKVIYETDNIDDVNSKEIELIKSYGRRDNNTGILTNHTDGGEGMLGYKHTSEHIHKLKTDNKGGQATAKPVYAICPNTLEITYYKSSNAAAIALNGLRSNIHQAATTHKQQISYGYYWRRATEYDPNENFTELNMLRDNSFRSSKVIEQYSLDLTHIQTWKSASDICRHYGNHVSTLHKYLKSGNSWKGYYWKFK